MKILFCFYLFIFSFFIFKRYKFQKVQCRVDMYYTKNKKIEEIKFIKNTKKINKFEEDKNKIHIECNNYLITVNEDIYCSETKEYLNIFSGTKDKIKKVHLAIIPGSKSYFDLENYEFNKIDVDEVNCSFYLKFSIFILKRVFLWINIFLFFYS